MTRMIYAHFNTAQDALQADRQANLNNPAWLRLELDRVTAELETERLQNTEKNGAIGALLDLVGRIRWSADTPDNTSRVESTLTALRNCYLIHLSTHGHHEQDQGHL